MLIIEKSTGFCLAVSTLQRKSIASVAKDAMRSSRTFLPSPHHSQLRSGVHLSSVSMMLPRHSHSFSHHLISHCARPLRANDESRERTRGRDLSCAPFLSRLTGCGELSRCQKHDGNFPYGPEARTSSGCSNRPDFTRPTLAVIPPARPESAETDSLPRDAPFHWQGRSERRGEAVRLALRGAVRPSQRSWRTEEPLQWFRFPNNSH